MIKIGILGDIGSGKSFVSKQFGLPIFNADKEVKKIYNNDRSCFIKLRKNKEITSCILSSLLTATNKELPPSTGITNNNLAKKHLDILKKMNFHATIPRINGKDIPI